MKKSSEIERRTSAGSVETRMDTGIFTRAQDTTSGAFCRLLDDKTASKYLGISRSLLRQYIKAGVLHRVLLPHPSGVGYINRMLLDVQELDEFIQKAKLQNA